MKKHSARKVHNSLSQSNHNQNGRPRPKILWKTILPIALAVIILISGAVYASVILRENNKEQIFWDSYGLTERQIIGHNFNINADQLYDDIQRISYEIQATAEAELIRNSQQSALNNNSNARLVTYTVTTHGNVQSSLAEFRQIAAGTLNDPRGWSRAGVTFQEVASGGQFYLILSEAQYLPSFSIGCSVYWSCRVGRYVIINDYRWVNATPVWNAAGESLLNYRRMVINHEVGHFLGHPDNNAMGCGPDRLAPVMQQQSIDLRGCRPNPWPLGVELWTNF